MYKMLERLFCHNSLTFKLFYETFRISFILCFNLFDILLLNDVPMLYLRYICDKHFIVCIMIYMHNSSRWNFSYLVKLISVNV